MINDLAAKPQADGMAAAVSFDQWFTLPLSGGQMLILIILFVSIFKFKNRKLQIQLNRLCVFLNVLLVGGIFYYTTMIEEKTGAAPEYGFAAIFPLIAIILLFMANNGIRKDEKLIRSADRLR